MRHMLITTLFGSVLSTLLMLSGAHAQSKCDLKQEVEGAAVPPCGPLHNGGRICPVLKGRNGMLHPNFDKVWANPNDDDNFEVKGIPGNLERFIDGCLRPRAGYEWVHPDDGHDFEVKLVGGNDSSAVASPTSPANSASPPISSEPSPAAPPRTPAPSRPAPASGGGPLSTRTGMSITFKSGGYRAVGLYVSCTNPQTGKTDTEVVGVNTTPESCALLLSKACASVGYSSPVKGANVEILGKGMVVKAVGPVFDKKDF